MELNVKEIPNESKRIKLEILKSLKSLNNEILNNYDGDRAVDFLKDENEDGVPDLVAPINVAIGVEEGKTAELDGALDVAKNTDGDNDGTQTDAEKLAVAQAEANLKENIDKIERLETKKRVLDNYLTNWTRMDLFPGITRENIYPRTAMERTQRRDFLGKGTGKVYPFGLKDEHQMSGVGGDASDIIKLRRLYGRANYWKKRDWSY
jgi:hypothetical protein